MHRRPWGQRPTAAVVGGPQQPTNDPVFDHKVHWDKQDDLRKEFVWTSETPSTMKVLLAQEDLWAIEQLLQIIDRVNADAVAAYNASIKSIDELQVGQKAAQENDSSDRIFVEGKSGSKNPPPAAIDATMGDPSAVTNFSEDELLLDGRYLDANGQPLTAANYNSVAEYRRLPVRMVLTMDEMQLPKLLVECARRRFPSKSPRSV